MTTKMELKIKTFEYILYKLVLWHDQDKLDAISFRKEKRDEQARIRNITGSPYKDTCYKVCSLSKDIALFFPYFICTASKDRQTLYTLFDNFFVTKEGIMEMDIVNHYVFGPESFSLAKPPMYEGVPYDLIDHSIEVLKHRGTPYFIYYDREAYSTWHKRQGVWEVHYLMAEAYNERVLTKYLVKEKSPYATSLEDLQICP